MARGRSTSNRRSRSSVRPIQPGSSNGYYYFILPNGNLYEFKDAYDSPALTADNTNLVANVGTGGYNDPTQVTNPSPNAPNVGLSINGNQLTISPGFGYSGTVVITASVSDGGESADPADIQGFGCLELSLDQSCVL